MVKQKSCAVDERPGEVLDDGKAFVFALAGAGPGILAQLHEIGIEMNRLFRFFQGRLQFGELGVGRQRR